MKILGTMSWATQFPEMDSAEKCNRLCQGIPTCTRFTFHAHKDDCSLFYGDPSLVDVDQEKKSGPVECPGIDSHILALIVCVESSDDFF